MAALPAWPGQRRADVVAGAFAQVGRVRALDDHLVDADHRDADVADRAHPRAGRPCVGAVIGGPVGKLVERRRFAERVADLRPLVSLWSWLRSADWVWASWMDVPQIWYAVKRRRTTPAPMRIRPEDVDDSAQRVTSGKSHGLEAGIPSHPAGPAGFPEWISPATVTRVPSGV